MVLGADPICFRNMVVDALALQRLAFSPLSREQPSSEPAQGTPLTHTPMEILHVLAESKTALLAAPQPEAFMTMPGSQMRGTEIPCQLYPEVRGRANAQALSLGRRMEGGSSTPTGVPTWRAHGGATLEQSRNIQRHASREGR